MKKLRITNEKARYAFYNKWIEDLDSAEANTLEEKLAKYRELRELSTRATELTVNKLKLARVEKELAEHNRSADKIYIERVESTGFDDTTKTNMDTSDYTEL